MSELTYPQFEADSRAQGFDEVLKREWAVNTVVGTHTHPFAVSARVVAGDVWLTVGENTRHLQAGDTFTLDAEVPHAERYGAQGATFWVARRNSPASLAA